MFNMTNALNHFNFSVSWLNVELYVSFTARVLELITFEFIN